MKPPSDLQMTDVQVGTDRPCVPGDIAVCHCTCTRRKGDPVFASQPTEPFRIRVGARDCYVGIEYGLLGMQVGGRRTVIVPPHLIYHERKTFAELPETAMLVYDLQLIDLPAKWDAEMESRLSQQ